MSIRTSVLDVADIPPEKPQLMPVWHTNVEDPCTARWSEVPVPSEPRIEGAQTKEANTGMGGEDFEVVALASSPILAPVVLIRFLILSREDL